MHEFVVQFHSLEDVQAFVTLCSRQNYKITVGSAGYQVNATSFMGMFTLNCRRPQTVTAECTEAEFEALLQAVQPYLCN